MSIRILGVFMAMFCQLFYFAEAKQPEGKNDFRLRPAIGGEQNGWFDAKGLPTALKINNEWVLPRGGTMEWLMSKGYVPHAERKNAMTPNPFDKRYKEPRPLHLPSLATRPVDLINTGISPRFKKSNDPFEGLADPMKRKYSPLTGAGASPGLPGQKANPGPTLAPEGKLPSLRNSPFAPPDGNSLDNGAPGKINAPLQKPKLPEQDPFADELNNPINTPASPKNKLNELPGKPIDIAPRNDNPFIPVKPNA